ncbi:hypothetical protein ACN38_g5021 [Penicillium nordicum]|uniref:Uncharacterized protein n=1 Tax=Penicillium nordicum TaxID=229535 RepID=A0A0M8P5Q5_9EURO|nr:hypothetical protein ACN38_g5021 [Penicillium nordicum]
MNSVTFTLYIQETLPYSLLNLSIAHKWAQAPGPQPNPQWAMGPVFKAQPNPQPINRRPLKPTKSPFLCTNIVLARIKQLINGYVLRMYQPIYSVLSHYHGKNYDKLVCLYCLGPIMGPNGLCRLSFRAHDPPMGPKVGPKTQPIWWVGPGWAMGFVGY